MSTYNGWKNWETWVCNLWLHDAYLDHQNDSQHKNVHDLADSLKEVTWEMIDDESLENLFVKEIVMGFVSAVDFRELAEHVMEDLQ